MCRMIAAAGRFRPGALRRGLLLMAGNANTDFPHERHPRGPGYRHSDGWGAAWVERGELKIRRRIIHCQDDPAIEEIDSIQTDLLLLHARRASLPGTVQIENTHPFRTDYRGRSWAFCHNGTINDLTPLRTAPGLPPSDGIDSEKLFHHILGLLDERDLEGSLLRALDEVEDYTSLNCFLATPDWILAATKPHPETDAPRYYAMWEGTAPGLHVVSSEPIKEIDCHWKVIPALGAVRLVR